MDIIWIDSDGTKKIIESVIILTDCNHKSDEIHIVHGHSCHDIWDEGF